MSRFRFGWSTTRTELPVLDSALTAQKRLKSEKKIAPRDSSMVVYPVPGLRPRQSQGFLMVVMTVGVCNSWSFREHVEAKDSARSGSGVRNRFDAHSDLFSSGRQRPAFTVLKSRPTPPPTPSSPAMSSPSDELAYLKSLVGQLTNKINELEAKAASKKPAPAPSPAQQLRTILIGPPGAGACRAICVSARARASFPFDF